jgi:DNA primase
VPIFDYVFRRKAEAVRGASAAERSRVMSEMRELIQKVEDPVFYEDAVRVASEALGVDSASLRRPGPQPSRTRSARPASTSPETRHAAPPSPLDEAGRQVLALALARPDLAAKPLRQGVSVPALAAPATLEPADFGDERQARIFEVLKEHAGEEAGEALSDERLRPLMDYVAALVSLGERLYPSEAAVREAWLRLRILSRQRAKRETPDYDEKERLRSEIQLLKETLHTFDAQS